MPGAVPTRPRAREFAPEGNFTKRLRAVIWLKKQVATPKRTPKDIVTCSKLVARNQVRHASRCSTDQQDNPSTDAIHQVAGEKGQCAVGNHDHR